MGEFSPVQLDALEDALEELELCGIPAELEADPEPTPSEESPADPAPADESGGPPPVQ